MKIKESKSIIIESDNAPLKISGRDGLSAYRVAKFHEKDNKNIKHAVYRTPGGAYYNRYYVKDIYGDEDELGNKGVVGPFTSEEDAVARLKDYKKDVVKESYRRGLKEGNDREVIGRVGKYEIIKDAYGFGVDDGYRVNRFTVYGDGRPVFDYKPAGSVLSKVKSLIKSGDFNNPHYNNDAKYVGNTLKYGVGVDESCKRRRIKEGKELVKLGRDPYDGYSILNDGYFVKRIYAESDEDAIRQFRNYLSKKEGLQERNLTSAERYNRNADRIFKDFDARNERMAQFLKDYGVSDDEIAELKNHTGLGRNALDDKMSELGIRKDFFDIEYANSRAERERADAEAKQKEMIKNLKWAKGFTTKEAKDWIKSHGSDEAREVINKALYPDTNESLKESKRGFVRKYKGCSIHDAGDVFVCTNEHGLNIGQSRTESGCEGLIDEYLAVSLGKKLLPPRR